MNSRKRLGELLVESGKINQEQLEQALLIHKRTGDRLGQVLVDLGYITETGLLRVLEHNLGIPLIDLSTVRPEKEAVRLVPMSLAERHGIIPIRKKGNRLMVAMVDPTNFFAIDDLRMVTQCEIEPALAVEADIQKAIDQYYGVSDLVEKSVSQIQKDEYTFSTEIETSEDAPVINIVNSLISQAVKTGASDIHLEPYEQRCRIRMRIDGKLTERYVVERAQYMPLVNQIKILASLDISEKRLPQDGRIGYDRDGAKFDVRVSTLPTIYGEKVVLRLLTRRVELLELRNLGFSARQYEDYCRAIARPFGMVLICGPTGSGKSTTLYATLRRLNALTDNILTIEDPIEYTLEGVNQVQLKEEIGLTFTAALRTFLRQDPDIIMLGEIRDGATAEMAVRSSLTGHLLFSTIHTNTAWGAVARLSDMGVHPYLVADTLVMTVAQRLARLLCPHCKRHAEATDEVRHLLPGIAIDRYCEPVGCERCFYTGYAGRRAVYEVIPMDDELAAAVRSGRTDVAPLLAERGIPSLRDAVVDLFRRGETSLDEVIPLLNY